MHALLRLRDVGEQLAIYAVLHVAFHGKPPGRHVELVISELNTRPTCASVNASPRTLPPSAHDSRPEWLARDSIIRDGGSTSRAIFQFNAGADGCLVEGFELAGARNGSHNGAGVRVNQANLVTVRRCNIHDNDMGIMSGGDGSPDRARGQRIKHCLIHHNGSSEDPGYNSGVAIAAGVLILMER